MGSSMTLGEARKKKVEIDKSNKSAEKTFANANIPDANWKILICFGVFGSFNLAAVVHDGVVVFMANK